MSINLTNTGRRFESIFKTDAGLPFPATLIPLDEGTIYANDFSSIRQLIRVRSNSPVGSGTIFKHPNGHLYLMGDHDKAVVRTDVLYRTHVLFQLNKQVVWSRETGTVDALTGLQKGSGSTTLGNPWVLLEQSGRLQTDLTTRIPAESLRLVTNEDVQLGDKLDEYIIRRVTQTLGVIVAEVQ